MLGAGGKSRQLVGTVTITGIIFSSLRYLLVPVLFVVIESMSYRIKDQILRLSVGRTFSGSSDARRFRSRQLRLAVERRIVDQDSFRI